MSARSGRPSRQRTRTPAPIVIGFNIAGAGPLRIEVFGALPPITEQVTIDGYTQTGSSVNTAAPAVGSNAILRVEIDGNAAMPTGLDLRNAPNSVVRGVSMFGFNNRAIDAGPGTTIVGSFIGLGSDGTTGYVAGTGIDVNGASGTRIGGPLAAERNIVAGIVTGIAVLGSDNVTITNNLIGLGPDGTQPSGPGLAMGVSVENTAGGVVIGGGAGLGNVISATGTAIQIRTGSTNVAVKGNLIGLAPDGVTPRGNSDGIDVLGADGTQVGGLAAGEGNVVANTGNVGVRVQGADNTTILREPDRHGCHRSGGTRQRCRHPARHRRRSGERDDHRRRLGGRSQRHLGQPGTKACRSGIRA